MCTGIITSLDRQTLAITGKVSIHGKRLFRDDIVKLMTEKGIAYKQSASGLVSILVHGDLTGQHVIDEWNKNSRKLEFVHKASERGRHICVVTSRGFSALLDGTPTACQTWQFEKVDDSRA